MLHPGSVIRHDDLPAQTDKLPGFHEIKHQGGSETPARQVDNSVDSGDCFDDLLAGDDDPGARGGSPIFDRLMQSMMDLSQIGLTSVKQQFPVKF